MGGAHPRFRATWRAGEVTASAAQQQAGPASRPAPHAGRCCLRSGDRQAAPRLQSAGTLMGFTHFTSSLYIQHIHSPLNSLCSQRRREVLPGHRRSHPQLYSWVCWVPRFFPLAVEKVQGTSSGVGITAVRAGEVGVAFRVPKWETGNWEPLDVTLLQWHHWKCFLCVHVILSEMQKTCCEAGKLQMLLWPSHSFPAPETILEEKAFL